MSRSRALARGAGSRVSPRFLRVASRDYGSFTGWYFVMLEKQGTATVYVLLAPSGLVWLDEPEDP